MRKDWGGGRGGNVRFFFSEGLGCTDFFKEFYSDLKPIEGFLAFLRTRSISLSYPSQSNFFLRKKQLGKGVKCILDRMWVGSSEHVGRLGDLAHSILGGEK